MAIEAKIDQIKKGKPFSKFDFIAISISIILCIALIISSCLNRKKGQLVLISTEGRTTEYFLTENNEIVLETTKGDYVIMINDGSVYVLSSPCSGQNCVRHTPIKYTGQIIVCADLRIQITIKSDSQVIGVT